MEAGKNSSWLLSASEGPLNEQVKLEEAESFAPPFDLEMLRISHRKFMM